MRGGSGRPFTWLLVPLVVCLATPSTAVQGAVAAAGMVLALAQTASLIGAERRSIRRARAAAAVHLGEDCAGRPVHLCDEHLSAHVLILGASGAGKTTTLTTILEAQIARGGAVIAVDLKGSPAFARTLARACLAARRPFRLWTPDGPSHWNPLEHGSATELKDRLMGSERFTEPHYERAAERHLQTVLQLLLHARPERRPQLAEVVTALEARRLGAIARGASGPLADRAREHLAALTPDQLSAVRGFATRLAVLSESDTGPWLAPGAGPSVDLRRALSGGEVVLFSLNSSTYGSLAAQLGSLAIQDLAGAIGHRLASGGGPPALVALDEFSAMRSANVLGLLARGREAGVSVVLATQELADLDRAARGFRDQVVGNTALKLIHRQDVPDSARAVAAMAGSEQMWEQRSRPARPALTMMATMLGSGRPSPPTARLVERERVRADEVSRLATGRAILIAKSPRAEVRIVRVRPAPGPQRSARSQPPPGVTR